MCANALFGGFGEFDRSSLDWYDFSRRLEHDTRLAVNAARRKSPDIEP